MSQLSSLPTIMEKVTLKDVCLLVTDGKHGDCQNQEASGYYFLSCKDVRDGKLNYEGARQITEADFTDTHRRTQLEPGEILITNSGTIGRMAIAPHNKRTHRTTFQKSVAILKPDYDKVNPTWLYYYLLSETDRLITFAGGTAQKNLLLRDMRAFEIDVPTRDTQRQVVEILKAYDDLIDNNTRRIEILEEMARRLYEEWFVHFRFPGHEEVRFKQSELGAIPEGWKPVAFSEVASFMNGFAFKPSHFTDDGLPVIKIKELKSGVTADTPRCSGEVKEKYLVKDGDVLFSWSAHLDAYIWRGGEGWLNQHLFKVDGVDGIPKSFLYFSLKEKMVDFRAKSMGTTMQHIKRSALNEVKFPMAAGSLTSKFDDLVTPILNQVLLLQHKNGNLRAQRDLLLPKLVSGEIDVFNIPMPDDKEVEAA